MLKGIIVQSKLWKNIPSKSIGSILFPLKVAPLGKETNFKIKGIKLRHRQTKLRQKVSLLKSPNFDAAYIKETRSVTMKIFRKKNFLFKSFVKIELSYVFTINMFSTAENCMEKWIIL